MADKIKFLKPVDFNGQTVENLDLTTAQIPGLDDKLNSKLDLSGGILTGNLNLNANRLYLADENLLHYIEYDSSNGINIYSTVDSVKIGGASNYVKTSANAITLNAGLSGGSIKLTGTIDISSSTTLSESNVNILANKDITLTPLNGHIKLGGILDLFTEDEGHYTPNELHIKDTGSYSTAMHTETTLNNRHLKSIYVENDVEQETGPLGDFTIQNGCNKIVLGGGAGASWTPINFVSGLEGYIQDKNFYKFCDTEGEGTAEAPATIATREWVMSKLQELGLLP